MPVTVAAAVNPVIVSDIILSFLSVPVIEYVTPELFAAPVKVTCLAGPINAELSSRDPKSPVRTSCLSAPLPAVIDPPLLPTPSMLVIDLKKLVVTTAPAAVPPVIVSTSTLLSMSIPVTVNWPPDSSAVPTIDTLDP